MVIDEASQVRVPEAAVPISLAGRAGRLVLAGDHLQLPPIINGVYPEPLPGQPVLHRSIFEVVAGPRAGLRCLPGCERGSQAEAYRNRAGRRLASRKRPRGTSRRPSTRSPVRRSRS